MAVVLIIKAEDGLTTELPILDQIIIGRSSSSDFKITDSKMSGQHCKIGLTAKGEIFFEDLGSTNGSYLNNSRVHKTILKINDVIRVGNTLIKIDESKLNAKERQIVGYSTHSNSDDKTLPSLSNSQMQDPVIDGVAAKIKKPTVVLNKDLLKRRKPTNEWNVGNENVIEQEESSGMTKMLKIVRPGKKKK